MKSIWIWFMGSLVAIGAFFRAIIFYRLRLGGRLAANIYELVRSEGRAFVFEEELTTAAVPKVFTALCLLDGRAFSLRISERMMKAGMQGTQSVIETTVFRWDVQWLKHRITSLKVDTGTLPIYILQPWDAEKIGELTLPEEGPPIPYLDESAYKGLEHDIVQVIKGTKQKTGAILYGPPGNGKSYLVRYFALKYQLPVFITSFVPDCDNHSLIRMFGNVKGPGIILLEDFDNYFDGRRCLLDRAKFTFDTVLNVLDGLFSTPHQLIYFMTANNLKKIDPALRSRPSRFKFRIRIEEPELAIRQRIVKSPYLAEQTDGLSLDSILMLSDLMSEGWSLGEAMKTVRNGELEMQQSRLEEAARLQKKKEKEEEPEESSKDVPA